MNTNILKRPLISEKSFQETTNGKFTFVVDKSAEKIDVKEVVEELFKVTVLDVNMISMLGKVKRSKKGIGRRSNFKKAIVTLKKGEKIDLFEIENPEENKEQKK